MSWETLFEAIRSLWVVWLMALFIGIVVWAFWPGRKASMESHGEIPLHDDDGER